MAKQQVTGKRLMVLMAALFLSVESISFKEDADSRTAVGAVIRAMVLSRQGPPIIDIRQRTLIRVNSCCVLQNQFCCSNFVCCLFGLRCCPT
ncbi:hypothetical protein Pcinc_026204 [Petrolisthes cinctipes]|uniref:Hepcidin n=1 Tax=Petrolisthes cinctipes TaxID=88211 RepID=A0AAE1F7Q2_PETCI|nr:hypothetical protein Pcinc_026204 [Petrolisthes cinctipes]